MDVRRTLAAAGLLTLMGGVAGCGGSSAGPAGSLPSSPSS